MGWPVPEKKFEAESNCQTNQRTGKPMKKASRKLADSPKTAQNVAGNSKTKSSRLRKSWARIRQL